MPRTATDPSAAAAAAHRDAPSADLVTAVQALSTAVQALTQVTQVLYTTSDRLAQVTQALGPDRGPAAVPGSATMINTWEDDPFSEATPTANPMNASTLTVPVPGVNAPLLR